MLEFLRCASLVALLFVEMTDDVCAAVVRGPVPIVFPPGEQVALPIGLRYRQQILNQLVDLQHECTERAFASFNGDPKRGDIPAEQTLACSDGNRLYRLKSLLL
ncbi:MAG: hypothetical protein K2R98_17310 [Gemmataceae bacterium]|nr:hypothetical protein [Gemmataceae bacterium]